MSWVLAGGLAILLLAHPSIYPREQVYVLLPQGVLLVWLAVLLREWRRWRLLLPPGQIVGTALLLWGGSILSWALSPDTAWKSLFFLGAQPLFLWTGWWLGNEPDSTKLLGRVALVGGGVAGGYGLFQHLQVDPFPPGTLFADRVVSVFENPNHFGSYLAGLLPLGLAAFFQARSWQVRLGWYALVGFLYTGLLLAGSRGAWWAALAGCLVFLGGYGYQHCRRVTRVRWGWAGMLLVLLGALTVWLSEETVIQGPAGPVSVRERMLSSRNIVGPGAPQDATVNHRYRIWQVTWEMIRQRPLLGQGYGAYPHRFVEVRKDLQEREKFPVEGWNAHFDTPYAHNEYLQVWAENGLLGLAGLVGLISAVVLAAVRAGWRARAERLELWGVLGLVAAILVDSLVSYPLHLPLNGMVFWLALGILANREFGRGKNQVKTDR